MIRISLRLRRIDRDINIVFFDMLVNGHRASGGAGGISIRASEMKSFLIRLQPDNVQVDREVCDERLAKDLAGFHFVRFV